MTGAPGGAPAPGGPHEGAASRSRRPPRILYLSKNFGFPLGGVRAAYHHVRLLAANGLDAAIALVGDSKRPHFEDDVPVVDGRRGLETEPQDIIVFPEPWHADMVRHRDRPIRRFVFVQNHFYMWYGLAGARSFGEIGIERVFCSSEVIAAYCGRVFPGPPPPVIHYGIDSALFRPRRKRAQIAFMPRKMEKEARFILETFRRLHPEFHDWRWVAIDRADESEVARILGESAIFLSLGRLEGLGLPPLEAMAAGCVVVGFLGDGGREFATRDNGLWCPAEDWDQCVGALARAARGIASRDPAIARIAAAGHETAKRYSFERTERELLAFWRSALAPTGDRSADPAGQDLPGGTTASVARPAADGLAPVESTSPRPERA